MEGRRTVCGIDWKNGIFGRCVTAQGRSRPIAGVESVFDSKLGLNFAFVDGLLSVRVWCESKVGFKMEIPVHYKKDRCLAFLAQIVSAHNAVD
jgi:hypothetical protein